jgi:hypothetical protein
VARHGVVARDCGDAVGGLEGDFTLSDRPIAEWVPKYAECYRRDVALAELPGNDNVPLVKLSTGTQIYAAAFGCPVHTYADNPPCALPRVRTADEADKLSVPDIWKTRGLYRIFELGYALQKELGKDIYLGPCDMQTGFDTASLVWNKEDFFYAMADDDEKPAVKRLIDKCAALYKDVLLALRREFPRMSPCHCPEAWCPPELGPWMSNDECGAMSVAMFEEFCLPEMIDLAETFGGIGMHCCADAEHQFASFRKIPNFYAFNRVSAKRGYMPLISSFAGQTFPVHCLCWMGPQEMRELVRGADPAMRFVFVRLGCDEPCDAVREWLQQAHEILAESQRV